MSIVAVVAVVAATFLALPLLRPLPTFLTRVGFRPIAFDLAILLLELLFSIPLAAAHGLLAFVAISSGRTQA